MTAPAGRPDWLVLEAHAMLDRNLPRVLAGMGFTRMHGPFPRGGLPVLDRAPPAAVPPNEDIGEWPARLLVQERDAAPNRAVYLCEVSGEWADHRGGARGESLIALGALMWGIGWGKAGWRIARLCGLSGVPVERAQPPGASALFRLPAVAAPA